MNHNCLAMRFSTKLLRIPTFNPIIVRTIVCHEEGAKRTKHAARSKHVHRVVMVRHGESEWNDKNLFTGWYDAELTARGKQEAQQAGYTLRRMKYCFDTGYTSVLSRAIDTLGIILEILNMQGIPVYRSWRLNERHYGALTGLNKLETAVKFGEDKVKQWRRSYDIPPPPMKPDHPYYTTIVRDTRYGAEPPLSQFPMYESLKLTLERTLPYWDHTIVPAIKKGRKVLIVAHGNSLRGIVKKLEDLSDDEIMAVNLPTGIPFQYLLDNNTMKPINNSKRRFLGDADVVRRATAAVANQGTIKKE